MLTFVKIVVVVLVLLQADRTEGQSCYNCFYTNIVSTIATDTNNCVKPTSNTPTSQCSGTCYMASDYLSVTRGCSSNCGFLTDCSNTCTGNNCNNSPAPFTTCYSCTSPENCVGATSRKEMCKGQCVKTSVTVSGTTLLSKSCSSLCVEMDAELFGVKTSTNCCSGDLCNGASGASLSAILLITIGLLSAAF